MSAKLKIGKFIGINWIKSITYPSLHRSIPLPIVPPSIKAKVIPWENLNDERIEIQSINDKETKRLTIDRKLEASLNKLNAAP